MKGTFLMLMCILLLSCDQGPNAVWNEDASLTANAENEMPDSYAWMIGKWKRVNEDVGKQTFENWERISATEYLGFGFTLQNGDTVSQEIMQIRALNGKWTFSAQLPDDSSATVFAVTEQGEKEFLCVNESNDFPKKIRYWFEAEKMKAKISNEKMEIPFEFERIR